MVFVFLMIDLSLHHGYGRFFVNVNSQGVPVNVKTAFLEKEEEQRAGSGSRRRES